MYYQLRGPIWTKLNSVWWHERLLHFCFCSTTLTCLKWAELSWKKRWCHVSELIHTVYCQSNQTTPTQFWWCAGEWVRVLNSQWNISTDVFFSSPKFGLLMNICMFLNLIWNQVFRAFFLDLGLTGAAQSWTHHQCKASSCSTFHGKACCQSQHTASLGNHEILQDRPAKKKKKRMDILEDGP